GVGVAGRVVSELGEHPGGQNQSQSWLGEQDLRVRVLVKTRAQLAFDLFDLGGEGREDGDEGGHRVAVGVGDERGGLQLFAAQGVADLAIARVEVALAACAAQRGDDPCRRQSPALRRGGGYLQDGQGVPSGELAAERDQRGRVELSQRRAQQVRLPLPRPDQV